MYMYKIQGFPNLGFFMAFPFQINSKKTTFTMAMQDVTIWRSKKLQLCWYLEISGCQNYQPNISKIDLNNFVALQLL